MHSTTMRHGRRGEGLLPRASPGPGAYAGSWPGWRDGARPGQYDSNQGSGSTWGQGRWGANGGPDGGANRPNQQEAWNQHGPNDGSDDGKYRPAQYQGQRASRYEADSSPDNGQHRPGQPNPLWAVDQQDSAPAANRGQYHRGQRQPNPLWAVDQQDSAPAPNRGQYQANRGSWTQHGPAQAADNGQNRPGQYQANQPPAWNQQAQAQAASNDHYPTGQYPPNPNAAEQQPDSDLPNPNRPDERPDPPNQAEDNVPEENNPYPITLQIPTATHQPTATLATSQSAATNANQQTATPISTSTSTSTASADADYGSSGMPPGEKAALVVGVIIAAALVATMILCPLRKRQKHVQAALGKNPKWKVRSETDSEKAAGAGLVDPVRQFAADARGNTNKRMSAATASLKPKISAAAAFVRPKTGAGYTRYPLGRSRAGASGQFDLASDAIKAREIEAGVCGGSGGLATPKESFAPKLPLMSAKSSLSETTTKRDVSAAHSRTPSVTGPGAGAGGGGTGPGTPQSLSHPSLKSNGTDAISPLEPLQPPPIARSLSSSSSTAWETQQEALSPAPSLGSPRSPMGSLDNTSTGNLLALNPSINERYVVERAFQPANPGQLEIRVGEEVGISQVFENGFVCSCSHPLWQAANINQCLCIRVDCSEAGLVPRSHLASAPATRAVRVDDKRKSANLKEKSGALSALTPRFYTFFRNSYIGGESK
jgi:hypothetical protein